MPVSVSTITLPTNVLATTPICPPEQQLTDQHYARLGETYEDAFFYDEAGDYFKWNLGHICAKLDLRSHHTFVDIGAGTGNFTAAMASTVSLTQRPVIVEPSEEMLVHASDDVVRIHSDAITFTEVPPADNSSFDRVLLKEMIHHCDMTDVARIFCGSHALLNPGGKLLIATCPRGMCNFPLFELFRHVCATLFPDPAVFAKALDDAGFVNIAIKEERFPCSIPKAQWYRMIRNRFWSMFAVMTDVQLEKGIAEIEATFPDSDILEFDFVSVLISGEKGAACAASLARG